MPESTDSDARIARNLILRYSEVVDTVLDLSIERFEDLVEIEAFIPASTCNRPR